MILEIPEQAIAQLCEDYNIRKLALCTPTTIPLNHKNL